MIAARYFALLAAAAAALYLALADRAAPTRADLPRSVAADDREVTFLTSPPSPEQPRAEDPERLLRELEPLATTNKSRALELALQADETLPAQGIFAEARRALIVTLLVDLQRMPEARERTRAYLLTYPDSRYSALVQGVTGVHPRPSPRESRDARPSAAIDDREIR